MVCTYCAALTEPPAGTGCFDLFALPARYQLDEPALRSAYRLLTRCVHPDVVQGDAEGQRLANRLSARINEAYEVLRDPIRRADYLLVQAGGPTAQEERDVPGELLAEVMMLREQVEEAKSQDDRAALAGIRSSLESKRRSNFDDIAQQAAKLPGATGAEKTRLRHLLNAARYYENLLAETAAESHAGDRFL